MLNKTLTSLSEHNRVLHYTEEYFTLFPAVLVWLNYKNAYEYWTEQRLALNKEVQYATRMVIDRLPQIGPHATNAVSTLFLQLTVDDIGLCLPISSFNSLVCRLVYIFLFLSENVADIVNV